MPTSAQNVRSRNGELDSGTINDRPVRWVGKYRILSELGRGGMSNVYLAVARGPGGVNKLVVLKAVLPELASEPGTLSMFLDEARLAAQLNHANVVQTYEVGTEGDRHVIVMEYLEGETLAHIARRAEQNGQAMSTAMYLRVIINALEGLHYAHELSAYDGSPLMLVHRDVSPQNIFVTYGGQVKVLDFGIAKASSSSTQTATGVVKGKIAYMAPEQMIADGLDRRADVYSVGCILWAAATGRKLWKDTPDVQIMRRVINGDVATPQSVNLACDDELNRIVMKAIASDPEQRYQTALALQEDLEHYCDRFSSPLKQKDIGAFVSTLFADARAELKSLVEQQVSQAMTEETGVTDRGSDVRAYGPPAAWQDSSGAADSRSNGAGENGFISNGSLALGAVSTGSSSEAELTAGNAQAAARRRLGLFIVVSGALLLAAFGVYSWRTSPAVSKGFDSPSVAALPAPAPAPPASATLEFRAQPAQAQLFLDGQRLASNPASLQLPANGSTHQLRAEAPGFASGNSEFSALRDSKIEIVLTVSAPANKAPIAQPRPLKRVPLAGTAPSARATSGQKVGCQNPFFVDTDGIKKLRPECM